jgi:hypothetical protein
MLSQALSDLDGKAELTAEDALAVRRIVFGGDCTISPDEAEALIRLNVDAGRISREWRALFVEALCDYIVHQEHPQGYVDQAKADWLMGVVRQEKQVRDDEVEMLIHVLEQADQTPPGFSGFVLDLVKSLALSGLRQGGQLSGEDVIRLRRVVFAAGGPANLAVSRREAEALFDINDAMAGEVADPVWTDLFVRAVGNAVLFETPWTPDAANEVKRQAWLEDASVHPFQRLAGLGDGHADRAGMFEGLREIVHWDFDDHQMDQALAADAALEERAAQVMADESHWLVERIRKNGRFDANERALLAFIRANASVIDKSLEDAAKGLDAQPAPRERQDLNAPRPVFGRRQASA